MGVSNMRNFLAIGVVLFLITVGKTREYAPRILAHHRADAYSMRTFAEFPRGRHLRGDALACRSTWRSQATPDGRSGLGFATFGLFR
jgi:hypothetical protein